MLEEPLLRQWIQEAKAGDAAAFERIVVHHERFVLRTAQRLLIDREDAKDAAQEVFLRLHRHLHRFREEGDLAPWLHRITVNVCLDVLRRAKRNPGAGEAMEAVDHSLNPEQELSHAQQRAMILAALGTLSPRERMAIVLREIEGCTTAEAARILGSSETTVRSQISTGRVKIRDFVLARLRTKK
jgi:RNA polymerase sigma-70 factor, ECF subfamily